MSTYKTKNPLGSAAVKDLYDNAENVDKFVNDRTKEELEDRLGVLRKTWHGMEMIFSRFIDYITGRGEQAVAAIGWQELGNWAVGLAVDNRQQIVYYNGSWYKYLGELEHVIAGDSPENDGGVWSAANPTGKWSNIGDAALRSNLGSSEPGFGADMSMTTIGKTVGDIVRSPYIITGHASIKAPYFNAPRDGAEDPEAAAANVAAINRMLNSGAKTVELDDKARQVNSPLIYQGSVGIYGSGREITSLIWTGGDQPALARPDYTNKEAKGFPNVRVRHLKIVDQAPVRNSYYTIDLFNGNSSGLDDCWIDCPGRYDADNNQIITSDRYGVALGIARNSTLKGDNGFVFHVRNSRITKGTLMANGTDGYISGCELWGDFRNRAVEISGGCTIDGGTQIVPGHEAGIFLFNDKGYDIDTLKIIGVYFDGSTNVDLFTGWGILSAAGIGLVNAKIVGCDFWHMNKGGIYTAKLYSSTIESNNFTDCDSDDTGEDDIYCDDVYGSSIVNVHARGLAPKHNNATRVNLGRNYSITAKAGYPLSVLGGQVSFSTTYARSRVTNPTYARQAGGAFASSFPYGALPDAAARYGEFIVVNGKPYASDGASWRDMSGDTLAMETATDLHALTVSQRYYTSDITMHSNIPAGLTGAAQIEVGYISAGYRVITVISLKASGGVYKQLLTGGTTPTWGLWLKIA
ncbi:hypothetical protein AAHW74_14365 [Klebsiella pneumoniae]|nr:hypothetical protein [Klebsiella pneumoniae]HDZ2709242.1 hypothetical protein [Klebsiella pneumoniae]